MGKRVVLVGMDRMVRMGNLVYLATTEKLVDLEMTDLREPREHSAGLDLKDQRAHREVKVSQGYKEILGQPGKMGHKETLDLKGPKENQDLMDYQETLERQDVKDLMGLKEKAGLKVVLDHLGDQEDQGNMADVVLLGKTDLKG